MGRRADRLYRRTPAWVRRYLPAEVVGTSVMVLAALVATSTGEVGSWLLTVVVIVAESIGFYGVMAASVLAEQRSVVAAGRGRRRRVALRTMWLLAAEFGPAEVLDTVTRPLITWAVFVGLGTGVPELILAKVISDAAFYGLAWAGYRVTRWLGWRRPRTVVDPTVAPEVRAHRLSEVRELLSDPRVDAAWREQTPLLVLEPRRAVAAHRRLRNAMPYAGTRYAVKALDHPDLIAALAADGAGFDVAGPEELDLVLAAGVPIERIVHTHPVKTAADIADAAARGVALFVVDSAGEIDKFAALELPGVRVLVRLSYPNPAAVSDLSAKFGVPPDRAEPLVQHAVAAGVPVAGFAFHVGSQLDDVAAFTHATASTLALIDDLECRLGVRFDVLDIGGGFPVAYTHQVATVEDVGAALAPLLLPRLGRLSVLTEPGRLLAAESMTLLSRVIGVGERDDGAWAYLDDGVYGSWSNVVFERLTPLLFTASELAGPVAVEAAAPPRRTTLAGPTCDSTDVVARDLLLPPLAIGDLVASPTMGAYTSVTATRFNGRPTARILVLDSEPALSLVACC